jgi:hypothetical protein
LAKRTKRKRVKRLRGFFDKLRVEKEKKRKIVILNNVLFYP